MLGELKRYCPNKAHGCTWVGEHEAVKGHIAVCLSKLIDIRVHVHQTCECISKTELLSKLAEAREEAAKYKAKCKNYKATVKQLTSVLTQLRKQMTYAGIELMVYVVGLVLATDSPHQRR